MGSDEFLKGASQALAEADYNLMIVLHRMVSGAAPKMISQRHVDGMIIAYNEDQEIIELLRRYGIPWVLVNAQIRTQCDCVLGDADSGMCAAIDHLEEQAAQVDLLRQSFHGWNEQTEEG